MAKERDARIFCRCGLMWDNRGACPHCDQECPRGVLSCARCALHSKQTDTDAHRARP
jgi:hypothetical protein